MNGTLNFQRRVWVVRSRLQRAAISDSRLGAGSTYELAPSSHVNNRLLSATSCACMGMPLKLSKVQCPASLNPQTHQGPEESFNNATESRRQTLEDRNPKAFSLNSTPKTSAGNELPETEAANHNKTAQQKPEPKSYIIPIVKAPNTGGGIFELVVSSPLPLKPTTQSPASQNPKP